jgi:hypothetical protein
VWQLLNALGDFVSFIATDHFDFGQVLEHTVRQSLLQANTTDHEAAGRVRTTVNHVRFGLFVV